MILRLHIFLAGCLALLLAALLAIAPVGAKPASGGYQLLGGAASGHQADIPLSALGNFDYFAKIAPECCNAPNTAGGTVEVFEPGANISPNSTLDRYPLIGRDGTFVTEVDSIERITGPIPAGATEIRITRQQADQLETDLGLNPGSLESSNTLSIVSDIQDRCPRCPVSGNDHFLGGGQGLPGGGSELVIDSIPSIGGGGVRQITVFVE